jgi:hypothetical protein
MSYSRRQLYAMGEPLGDSVTRRKAGGGLVLGDGGGGGSNNTGTTSSSSNIPDWALGYAKDTLYNASQVTDLQQNPYKTYEAPRVAGFAPLQEQAQYGAANMSGGPQAFQQNIGSYMSPYMQNVVDVQKQEAARQSGILGTQQQAQAAQAGAFGGGRDAIMRAERERNLGQQMNQIQAQGSQAAYDQAANQFRQGLTQDVAINQLQNQYGGQQQQLAQKGLDLGYQDFLNQQNYPYKQLGFMSDMLRGLPLGQQSTQQIYQPPPSTMATLGGLGMGAYGLSRMAEGGRVQGYANGGDIDSEENVEAIVRGIPATPEGEQRLMQSLEMAMRRGDRDQENAIREEMAMRASLRRGLASGVTSEMADNMVSAANGGIVAFAQGGEAEKAQRDQQRAEDRDMLSGLKASATDLIQMPGKVGINIGEFLRDKVGGGIARAASAITDTDIAPPKYSYEDLAANSRGRQNARKDDRSPLPSLQNSAARRDDRPNLSSLKGTTDTEAPVQKGLSKPVATALKQAAENAEATQGIPAKDFMSEFDSMYNKLQNDPENKADLAAMKAMKDKMGGSSKEIKEQAFNKALAVFGFNMAAKGAQPGRGSGLQGLLASAGAAAPDLMASIEDSQKLAREADKTNAALEMEMIKYRIAERKGDKQTAMQHAVNMRQLQQSQQQIGLQQQQLNEQIRSNKEKASLMSQRIASAGAGQNPGLKMVQATMRGRAEALKLAQKEVNDRLRADPGASIKDPQAYDRMLQAAMKRYLPMTTGFGMSGMSKSQDNSDDVIDMDS